MIKGLLSFLSPVPSGTADNLQKAVITDASLDSQVNVGGTDGPANNEYPHCSSVPVTTDFKRVCPCCLVACLFWWLGECC